MYRMHLTSESRSWIRLGWDLKTKLYSYREFRLFVCLFGKKRKGSRPKVHTMILDWNWNRVDNSNWILLHIHPSSFPKSNSYTKQSWIYWHDIRQSRVYSDANTFLLISCQFFTLKGILAIAKIDSDGLKRI